MGKNYYAIAENFFDQITNDSCFPGGVLGIQPDGHYVIAKNEQLFLAVRLNIENSAYFEENYKLDNNLENFVPKYIKHQFYNFGGAFDDAISLLGNCFPTGDMLLFENRNDAVNSGNFIFDPVNCDFKSKEDFTGAIYFYHVDPYALVNVQHFLQHFIIDKNSIYTHNYGNIYEMVANVEFNDNRFLVFEPQPGIFIGVKIYEKPK